MHIMKCPIIVHTSPPSLSVHPPRPDLRRDVIVKKVALYIKDIFSSVPCFFCKKFGRNDPIANMPPNPTK